MSGLAGWTPRPLPPRAVHEGRLVRLEPLDPAVHGDDLFEAGSGPEAERLWLYLGERPFADRASFQPWLDKAAASPDPLFFAIVDRASGKATGRLALMRIDPAHGVIEVGNILYGPALARTPGATEAISLLASHIFDDLGYRRFEWKCNDLNAPSKRAALRLGFTHEGLFRQHMVVKGENRDTAWFSMLDREWPQRKGAFRRFLAPENFSADGTQRLALSALNAPALTVESRTLRRANASDAAAIDALQQAAYAPNRALIGAEPVPLLTRAEDLLASHEIWLLEHAGPDGGGLAGVLVLDPRAGDLEVWSLATAPSHQGQGIGRVLLTASETRARALGLCTLRLFTSDKLSANVAWYGRNGYVVERTEERADRRLVHMMKTLE